MFRAIRKKLFRMIVVSGAGAAANYFFDKDRGEERRAQAKEKANGLLGRPSAGGTWQAQSEHSANGFDPQPTATAAPTSTAPYAAPTVADVIAEPQPQPAESIPDVSRPVGS